MSEKRDKQAKAAVECRLWDNYTERGFFEQGYVHGWDARDEEVETLKEDKRMLLKAIEKRDKELSNLYGNAGAAMENEELREALDRIYNFDYPTSDERNEIARKALNIGKDNEQG